MNARTPNISLRELAREVLRLESSRVPSTEPGVNAAGLVCEALRRPLCALAGTAGCRALMGRALSLARVKAPGLLAVRVGRDSLMEGWADVPADGGEEAGLVLISELLELLAVLIGEGLTLSVLAGVWPELRDFRAGSNGVKQP